MKIIYTYLVSILAIIPLLACQKNQDKSLVIDNKSYINNFEILQENPNNDYSIRISSPRAILDPVKNDIEIIDSQIKIFNSNGKELIVKSGNSTLTNSNNLISVFNDVSISLVDSRKKHYIKTNSFNWYINSPNINFNSPIDFNYDNTTLFSLNGTYNIDSSQLKLHNNIFNSSILSEKGNSEYKIEIKSDIARWIKNDNSFQFISNNKQVETTINLLTIK